MPKYLYLNLKRFDVLRKYGGVNDNENISGWAESIIKKVLPSLKKFKEKEEAEFVVYMPELHLFKALEASDETLSIGCQGIFYDNVSKGGNFGAFTTHRVAAAMEQIGIKDVIIGHFEERKDKGTLLEMGVGNRQNPGKQIAEQRACSGGGVGNVASILYRRES